jgi:hypothetical protein
LIQIHTFTDWFLSLLSLGTQPPGWKYGPKLGECAAVDVVAEEGEEGLVLLGVEREHAALMVETAVDAVAERTKQEKRTKQREEVQLEREQTDAKSKAERRHADNVRRMAAAAAPAKADEDKFKSTKKRVSFAARARR